MSLPPPDTGSRRAGPVTTTAPDSAPATHPPASTPGGAGDGSGRKVAATSPNPDHRVSIAPDPQKSPQGQSVQSRNPAPVAAPSTAAPSAGASSAAPGTPEAQMKQHEKNLSDVMGKMWVHDQLNWIEALQKDPSLAAKMGITVKIQYPGTDKPTQIFPVAAPPEGPGPAHQSGYEQYLQAQTSKLRTQLNAQMPPKQLFQLYTLYRSKLREAGEEVANAKGETFEWGPIYYRLLNQSFDRSESNGEVDFTFFRGHPDPAHAIDPQILAGLERNTPPPKPAKSKKKKKDEGLDKPQVEFRLKASQEDLQRHASSIHRAENQPPAATPTTAPTTAPPAATPPTAPPEQ